MRAELHSSALIFFARPVPVKPNLKRFLTDVFCFEPIVFRLKGSDGVDLKCAVSGTVVLIVANWLQLPRG